MACKNETKQQLVTLYFITLSLLVYQTLVRMSGFALNNVLGGTLCVITQPKYDAIAMMHIVQH